MPPPFFFNYYFNYFLLFIYFLLFGNNNIYFFTTIMMLFFKDSKIGEEPALFIYKKKDGKDAKPTTLIVRPPIIGRF